MTGKYKLLTRIQQKVESPRDQYPFQRKPKKKNYTSTNSKKEKKKASQPTRAFKPPKGWRMVPVVSAGPQS